MPHVGIAVEVLECAIRGLGLGLSVGLWVVGSESDLWARVGRELVTLFCRVFMV